MAKARLLSDEVIELVEWSPLETSHSSLQELLDNLQSSVMEYSRISRSNVEDSLNTMVSFVSGKKPDFLIGLNIGGIIVGSYLASNLQIPENRFIKCSVSKYEKEYKITIYTEEEIYGKVLIIDDISRSGLTMEIAKRHIEKEYRNNLEIITATLVAFTDENTDRPLYENLDFYSYKTHNLHLLFPWTMRKEKNYDENTKIELFDELKGKPLKEIAFKMSQDIANF